LTSCVSCDPNITPALYLSGTSCGTTCPDYYYPDSITRICIACSIPCSTCTSVTNCITCTTGYSLYGLSCILTCPSGYLSVSNIC
jgi:proprotein convertase subtilisin/kexin type 5